ncbi:DUF3231 family protein [Halobacillus litoralis]|uniref:DUF3231 domain-containing protein n=1 Tax=Halobacillus litoralis TaxID=45668 RepID=A0A410MDR6_9BACI|nr:DUF3231 family protein [Halobacillus litoralis]QAS52871.1 hypothetical protein HLI_12030 [Halobacillus litoralis]
MSQKILTANEIGVLWTQYMENSMTLPLLDYFEKTLEDDEIHPLLEVAKQTANNGVSQCTQIFKDEHLPVPDGYGKEDLNPNAPKLFTDAFILNFLEHLGKVGLTSASLSLGTSASEEVRDFFTNRIERQSTLYNQCVELGMNKGLYVRAPQVEIQDQIEYVKGKSYLHPFNKRSLNAIEISHLFENYKTNSIGEVICQGFAQTGKNKTIKKYMREGKNLSIKHRKLFSSVLDESGIQTPMTSSNFLTMATDPVFSDRLMIYLIGVLSSAGHGNYATASSASLRYDLIFTYQRLSVDIAMYAKDGMDIMIKNGWFEEPPQAPDRQQLIQ